MTVPRLFVFLAVLLFGFIGITAWLKKPSNVEIPPIAINEPVEIPLLGQAKPIISPAKIDIPKADAPKAIAVKEPVKESIPQPEPAKIDPPVIAPVASIAPPEVNRIEELFSTTGSKLPIIETVTYKSRVDWQKGRPAWLADYSTHYHTSRHFIARSLNGTRDYLKQEVKDGNRFNVFRLDKNIAFTLVVDTSRCKMWLYYNDLDSKENVLLKTYAVGLGRIDGSKTSGLLTPLGTYSLGNRIATYKASSMGNYQGEKIEMITVFGTRWIPFDKELSGCTLPSKGFGIHGTPLTTDAAGQLVDQAAGIGKYDSDGCIRVGKDDMEELYAIIVTKPATIEIVRDFWESSVGKQEKK